MTNERRARGGDPFHCTGDEAVDRLKQTHGERVVPRRARVMLRLGGTITEAIR